MGEIKDIGIEQFQYYVHFRLEDLKKCMKTVEEALKREEQFYIIKERLKGKKVDYIGLLLGNEHFYKIVSEFSKILRESFFITLYAFFENTLTVLCEIIRAKRNYSIEISDIRDKGIFAAKTYIEKVANFPFPEQSSYWKDICVYNKIRNCIVHRGGQIADRDKKLIEKFTKRKLSIDLILEKDISLSEGFCLKFVNIMEDFLEELFKGIVNEINKA